jgi:hypothetical protein
LAFCLDRWESKFEPSKVTFFLQHSYLEISILVVITYIQFFRSIYIIIRSSSTTNISNNTELMIWYEFTSLCIYLNFFSWICIPFNFQIYTNKQTTTISNSVSQLYTVKRYVSSVCRCQFNLTVKNKRVYAKMKNTGITR